MILSFSQQIAGKPTHFVDKILLSSMKMDSINTGLYIQTHKEKFNELLSADIDAIPKHHTIREDGKNRWKAGNLIHPVINNRSKDMFQFCPVLQCKSVQDIQINYWEFSGSKEVVLYIDNEVYYSSCIRSKPLRWRSLINESMDRLARNDGFENKEEFFNYFNYDFNGKIIHWTDLQY